MQDEPVDLLHGKARARMMAAATKLLKACEELMHASNEQRRCGVCIRCIRFVAC